MSRPKAMREDIATMTARHSRRSVSLNKTLQQVIAERQGKFDISNSVSERALLSNRTEADFQAQLEERALDRFEIAVLRSRRMDAP
jgi:hypothetical protein